MRLTTFAWGTALLSGLTCITGCGWGSCEGFALSLASDHGGQTTPTEAAAYFAVHGGISGLPLTGWQRLDGTPTGTSVRSGRTTLHALQGSDGTWQIDSGEACR